MQLVKHLIVGVIGLLVPLIAEFISPESGLGFDVLLYWPFHFAYMLTMALAFLVVSWMTPAAVGSLNSIVLGATCWAAWFAITFLAVAGLHVSLGYQL